MYPAKTGDNSLIIFDFVILMPEKIENIKIRLHPQPKFFLK